MEIKNISFSWNGKLTGREKTELIILHHRAGDGDVYGIHNQHLKQGYTGIGYHFYVRKDGGVYRGRPQNAVGAHCVGFNSASVGICFEGNFESEEMSAAQKKAGTKLIAYLKNEYPKAEVFGHKELFATVCPGSKFPLTELKTNYKPTKELTSANDITWELSQKITINDVDGFVAALENARVENSPLYWGFYKVVNN